jgi:N-acetylglucosaminyldiphosphoundecaprenol N-acetyl-beta-D-mannosaminyltransferase
MAKITLLNVSIDNIPVAEALLRCDRFLTDGFQHFIVTPNPEFLVAAHADKEFAAILNHADLALADGIGLKLAALAQGQHLTRIAGTDFVYQLCDLAAEKERSVYFLGAGEGVAKQTAEKLQRLYSTLKVVGAESGGEVSNKSQTSSDKTIQHINEVKPDILFVALGQVKQEKWIFKNLDTLPSVKIAIGIGGAFDYIAGNVTRAPRWMRSIGLEWLFRLIVQPKRWKRIFNAVVVFPWLVLKSWNLKHKI